MMDRIGSIDHPFCSVARDGEGVCARAEVLEVTGAVTSHPCLLE